MRGHAMNKQNAWQAGTDAVRVTSELLRGAQSGPQAPAAIVIPNWNGLEHLMRCLPALHSQTLRDFQILLVDNGSTDNSIGWVQQHHPEVDIVVLQKNSGFATACNAGIRETDAELIITLNNDTVPRPDWLAELVKAATQHRDVGMFASTLWLERETPVIDAAGLEVNRLGVAWNTARGVPVAELSSSPQETFGPCAGAALYRRALFVDVGLFDETYFAYLEDVELAWRARWAGWRCISVPASAVWHAHSATGGRNLPLKYWLLGRNRLWTTLRHYPRPYLWSHLPLIVMNELVTGFLGMIVLRNPAPISGRVYALRRWRSATGSPFTTPRRIPPAEAFGQLTPLPSLSSLVSSYVNPLRGVTSTSL
jgi:GT2 family glycosyltransferase